MNRLSSSHEWAESRLKSAESLPCVFVMSGQCHATGIFSEPNISVSFTQFFFSLLVIFCASSDSTVDSHESNGYSRRSVHVVVAFPNWFAHVLPWPKKNWNICVALEYVHAASTRVRAVVSILVRVVHQNGGEPVWLIKQVDMAKVTQSSHFQKIRASLTQELDTQRCILSKMMRDLEREKEKER